MAPEHRAAPATSAVANAGLPGAIDSMCPQGGGEAGQHEELARLADKAWGNAPHLRGPGERAALYREGLRADGPIVGVRKQTRSLKDWPRQVPPHKRTQAHREDGA